MLKLDHEKRTGPTSYKFRVMPVPHQYRARPASASASVPSCAPSHAGLSCQLASFAGNRRFGALVREGRPRAFCAISRLTTRLAAGGSCPAASPSGRWRCRGSAGHRPSARRYRHPDPEQAQPQSFASSCRRAPRVGKDISRFCFRACRRCTAAVLRRTASPSGQWRCRGSAGHRPSARRYRHPDPEQAQPQSFASSCR